MVALDTEMNEELEMLGLSRELVSRIQALRKESGFDITDRISLCIQGSVKLLDAVKKNDAYIKAETLTVSLIATAFDPSSAIKGRQEMVNGESCFVSLEKYAS